MAAGKRRRTARSRTGRVRGHRRAAACPIPKPMTRKQVVVGIVLQAGLIISIVSYAIN